MRGGLSSPRPPVPTFRQILLAIAVAGIDNLGIFGTRRTSDDAGRPRRLASLATQRAPFSIPST
jgi:hypothetical protein